MALPLSRDEGALAGSRCCGWVPTRQLSAEGKPRGEVHPADAGGTRRRIQRHPGSIAYHIFALHPHANQESLRVDRVPPLPASRLSTRGTHGGVRYVLCEEVREIHAGTPRRTLSVHEVGTRFANPRLQYVKEKWC